MPLIVQDRVVGVMDLESERMGYFTEEHARLLALLAPQIASSVENARLYEEIAQREQWMDRDLKAARNVQSVLLPREAPEIEGLDVAIRLRPAREITGDVYDFSSTTPATSCSFSATSAAKARQRRFMARWSAACCGRSPAAAASPARVAEAAE